MATIFTDGFESGDLSNWSGSTLAEASTDVAFTGTYSGKLHTSGGAYMIKTDVMAIAGRRTSFRYRSTNPVYWVASIAHVGGTSIFGLFCNGSSVLQLFNGDNLATQIGSDGPTLSANTWYRIAISFVVTSTTVYEVRVYVNGTLAISGTDGPTLIATNHNSLMVGNSAGGSGNSYVDDVYIDDGTDLADPLAADAVGHSGVAASVGVYSPRGTTQPTARGWA